MQLQRSLFVALLGAPFLALAQGSDRLALTLGESFQITAGEPVTITWRGEAEGTISLILRSGEANNLAAGTVIAGELRTKMMCYWSCADASQMTSPTRAPTPTLLLRPLLQETITRCRSSIIRTQPMTTTVGCSCSTAQTQSHQAQPSSPSLRLLALNCLTLLLSRQRPGPAPSQLVI